MLVSSANLPQHHRPDGPVTLSLIPAHNEARLHRAARAALTASGMELTASEVLAALQTGMVETSTGIGSTKLVTFPCPDNLGHITKSDLPSVRKGLDALVASGNATRRFRWVMGFGFPIGIERVYKAVA